MSETTTHYHVAYGIGGYGPDASDTDGFATFETLSDALEYARDELDTDIDGAHESAHALAESQDYEGAWREIERMESLDSLRANLSPRRRLAPLYVNDDAAYAALQESQAALFPVDVSQTTRLYLWDCSNSDFECRNDEEESA